MLNAILTNWTAQLSLITNNLPSEKPKTIHETVTENTVKPTTKTQLEVIEVDPVEPATRGNFSDFDKRFTASWCTHAQAPFHLSVFVNLLKLSFCS